MFSRLDNIILKKGTRIYLLQASTLSQKMTNTICPKENFLIDFNQLPAALLPVLKWKNFVPRLHFKTFIYHNSKKTFICIWKIRSSVRNVRNIVWHNHLLGFCMQHIGSSFPAFFLFYFFIFESNCSPQTISNLTTYSFWRENETRRMKKKLWKRKINVNFPLFDSKR